MKTRVIGFVAAAALGLAACENMSQQQKDELAAGIFGAGAAGITAAAFDASAGWIVVAAAAGAATGALIARNNQTGECAYSDGSGGYTTGAC
ncbi:MAG: glucose-6-phosphate isomerase [Pseudomonadota bacterium]